jgi:uncharacterized protein (TIGR02246 family)
MHFARKYWLCWAALAAISLPLHADDPELPKPAADTVPVAESPPKPAAVVDGADTASEPTPSADSSASTEDAPEVEHADVAAIRSAIDSYVAAFNAGDAAKLAGHFTENAEVVTPAGTTWKGRAEIEENFAGYFKTTEGTSLELAETAVQLLSPAVGLESGIARVSVGDEPPTTTEYEAIHVKTGEGWKIDSVRETEVAPPPPSHYENLRPLEWMIGRWVDADGGAVVETNVRWTTNQNFIVRSFKVFVEDRVDFEGSQIIGWDPHAQTIRSWTFDSDGGIGVGRWSGGGNRWTVQTLFVRADGSRGSSTNIYELVDDDTVRFRSVTRQVDGELLPNLGPIEIVRSDASAP